VVHVIYVHACRQVVFVVVFDDRIEQRPKGVIRIVGTSIHSDPGVNVLAATQYSGLEPIPITILSILELTPDLGSQMLSQERVSWCISELRQSYQVLCCFNMRAAHNRLIICFGAARNHIF